NPEGARSGPSIDALHDTGLKSRERPHVANSIPGIRIAWRLTFRLIALEETGHKEFAGEGSQPDAAGLAVSDEPVGIIGVHYFNHRTGGRRIVDTGIVVLSQARFMDCQSHQCVPIGWREIDAFEQLLDSEAIELRSHFGSAAKHAGNAGSFQGYLFAERLEQL